MPVGSPLRIARCSQADLHATRLVPPRNRQSSRLTVHCSLRQLSPKLLDKRIRFRFIRLSPFVCHGTNSKADGQCPPLPSNRKVGSLRFVLFALRGQRNPSFHHEGPEEHEDQSKPPKSDPQVLISVASVSSVVKTGILHHRGHREHRGNAPIADPSPRPPGGRDSSLKPTESTVKQVDCALLPQTIEPLSFGQTNGDRRIRFRFIRLSPFVCHEP
jgi:hypothetical protein